MSDMLQLVVCGRTQFATLPAILFLECRESLREAEACRTLMSKYVTTLETALIYLAHHVRHASACRVVEPNLPRYQQYYFLNVANHYDKLKHVEH